VGMKKTFFPWICVVLGLITLTADILDRDFMAWVRDAEPVRVGHISYAVFGIPGLLTLSGILQLTRDKIGKHLFLLYAMCLSGWILTNMIFLIWIPFFNIFNSVVIAIVHLTLGVLGSIYLVKYGPK